ncbi:MAG TPA: hypothetical protein VHD60_02610 [Candidatus Saccharimonadales bacterium]|nr:hypothetical protein [Candidatus Saccharimonadales bacterium]
MHSYSTNTSRLGTYSVIAAISVAIAVLIAKLTSHYNLGPTWLVSPPALGGVYGIVYATVDKILWKWTPLRMFGLINEMRVYGVYEGIVISDYNHKELPVRIEINQTWTKILVQLEVLEPELSASCSITTSVEGMGNRCARLTYTYRNTPNHGIADDDMQGHEGTGELIIKPNGTARGRYFNSRGRKGTLRLNRSN